MLWTNNLRETDVDGHSSDSKSHKIPDLPHHSPNESTSIKEDYNPSQEIRVVKTHIVHDRCSQLEKEETEPTQVLLGLSPTIQPINKPRISTAFSLTPTETKGVKRENEEILLAARSKIPRQVTGAVRTVIYTQDVVGKAGNLSHHVTLETPPSNFDPSSK